MLNQSIRHLKNHSCNPLLFLTHYAKTFFHNLGMSAVNLWTQDLDLIHWLVQLRTLYECFGLCKPTYVWARSKVMTWSQPFLLQPPSDGLYIYIYDLYCSPNIVRVIKSRRMIWAPGYVARMGEGTGVHRVLVGKAEGKRPLGRSRCRWEDNIRMDLREVGCGGMDWIELAQDRDKWQALVNALMNFWVP